MKNYPFSGCLQGRLGGDSGLSLGQGETFLAGGDRDSDFLEGDFLEAFLGGLRMRPRRYTMTSSTSQSR